MGSPGDRGSGTEGYLPDFVAVSESTESVSCARGCSHTVSPLSSGVSRGNLGENARTKKIRFTLHATEENATSCTLLYHNELER